MADAPLTLSVVIPAHNEAEGITATLRTFATRLRAEAIPFELVVVDDHSTDGTDVVLAGLAGELPELRRVENARTGGFGHAVIAGLEAFSGDAVAIVMADASDDPADLVTYYRTLAAGYDCVFGSRFVRGARVVDYPRHKLLLNRLANQFIRLLFGLRLNDTTNAFKCYRREAIEGCRPYLSKHFNLTVELPLKAIVRGYSYAVVPINWYNRTTGVSKLKIKEMGSRYLFIVLYVWLEKLLSRGDYARAATPAQGAAVEPTATFGVSWLPAVSAVGLAMAGAVVLRVALVGASGAATFWDSPSYLDYARHVAAHLSLPPLGMRTPGFPLFVLLAGGSPIDLEAVRWWQQALGVLGAAMACITMRLLTRSWLVAVSTALLLASLVDLLFMEVTIYSESLASATMTGLALAVSVATHEDSGPRRRRWACWATSALAALGALVRPALVVVGPAVAIALWLSRTRAGVGGRDVLRIVFLPVVLVGLLCTWNLGHGGSFKVALGQGFSLLNYVGRPEVYAALPDSQRDVRLLYEAIAREHGVREVGWGESLQPVLRLMESRGQSTRDWDSAAARFAATTILHQPGGYVRVWARTAREYLTDYFVWYGLFENETVPQVPERAQVDADRFRRVRWIEAWWDTAWPYVALFAVALAPIAAALSGGGASAALFAMWTATVVYSLTTTMVDPSPGQMRYRLPVEPVMLMLAIASLAGVVRRVRSQGAQRPAARQR